VVWRDGKIWKETQHPPPFATPTQLNITPRNNNTEAFITTSTQGTQLIRSSARHHTASITHLESKKKKEKSAGESVSHQQQPPIII
jgi:hypothetical protein